MDEQLIKDMRKFLNDNLPSPYDPTKLLFAKDLSDIEVETFVDKKTGKRYTDVTESVMRDGEGETRNYLRRFYL